jgi:hypothetical protein
VLQLDVVAREIRFGLRADAAQLSAVKVGLRGIGLAVDDVPVWLPPDHQWTVTPPLQLRVVILSGCQRNRPHPSKWDGID